VGGAELKFAPAATLDDWFTGVSAPNGTYQVSYRTLEGLPVDHYQITIKVASLPSGVPFPPGEQRDSLLSEGKLVEASYAFEKDIVAGENHIDFELTEGKKLDAPAQETP
jgi:hypothetical protein